MLLWDVADKFKFPKRGFMMKTTVASLTSKTGGSNLDTYSGVNCLRQKASIRNGFVAVSNSGAITRVELPPVINDGVHKNMLSNPGSKLTWTPDAIAFMSNIGSNTGEVIAVKAKAERYIQDNSAGGKQVATSIDIDTLINSKPDMAVFYPTPVISDCDPHFHSCFKVLFHPQHE